MPLTEYIVSVLFICVFIVIVAGAADNLYELYAPPSRPKKSPPPKQNTITTSKAINNTISANGMPFAPSKIKQSHTKQPLNSGYNQPLTHVPTYDEDEKKEYEDINTINPTHIITKADTNNPNTSNTDHISSLLPDNDHENDTSTTTLAYFLELQSRLQHLESLLNIDINDDNFHAVNTYYNDKYSSDDKPLAMLSGIHANNMKLVECMIQNVIYDKSHANVKEADSDFYNKLKHDTATNWSRSRKNKRRPSIEQRLYRNMDYSMGYALEMAMKLTSNPKAVSLVTSSAVLYSCGVLYFCVDSNANVSIFSYLFGIFLVFIVMIIGYCFNISSGTGKKYGNEFIIATVLSVVLIYLSLFWISYYFNTTVSFILIMAILLSYQYKHGPIYAKQRNFDEIWVCLLLNCGLPLFAYYLQLPEMQTLTLQPDEAMTDVFVHDVIVEEVVAADTVINDTETPQSWLVYIFNVIYYIITVIFNDFWNMLDITYALDENETVQQQQVQITEQPQNETETEAVRQELPLNEEMDDTLYWFNKLFYIFPYGLFNIILISWFITHSSMLLRNLSVYKTVNIKLLYCVEIVLAYLLSIAFWYNNVMDVTFFYWMVVTVPWTIGLLKHIWEHVNIQNDAKISVHSEVFNLWFFISIYLSFVYNWIYQTGIFFSLFSPNLLIVVAPFYFIIQCMPSIVNEFVWATDF